MMNCFIYDPYLLRSHDLTQEYKEVFGLLFREKVIYRQEYIPFHIYI